MRIRPAVMPAATRALPLGVAVLALGWLALRTHQTGHDWGDDFALYIRQARGIVEGNPAEVVSDNRFSLQASSWSTFSPEAYPWGWPLLMAPVVMLRGTDYALLKLLVVVLWCAALVFWHLIVRERAGTVTAWVLMLALGVSWPLVTWTNSVVSDLPYLAGAFAALWLCDRCRRRNAWTSGSMVPLVSLGLALAFVFNIRREGLAVVAAVAALNLVQFLKDRAGFDWRRALIPFGTFLSAAALFQLVMPSVVAPSYPGAGLGNVPDHLEWYRDVAAQQLGLYGPDQDHLQFLGSHGLGLAIFTLVFALAAVGLVTRCITRPTTDLPLATFLAVHLLAVGIAPFHEGRYLFPVTPVIVYFAAVAPQGTRALAQRLRRERSRPQPSLLVVAPVLALVGLLGLASLQGTWSWANNATILRDAGAVMDGPEDPDSLEMFDIVRTTTRPDDVIAFFRARAMTLSTERSALQSSTIEIIIERADWYVMRRGSTYSQPLISEDEAVTRGLERAWSNDDWIMYRVSDRARELLASTTDDG